MIAKLQCVVLDCADVGEQVRFYQALVGGDVNRPDRQWALSDGWATLHLDGGLVPAFQRVADHRPPRWPDPARPQQFHLDLGMADLDRARREALDRGATLLADKQGWLVLADPAGHPFCLVEE